MLIHWNSFDMLHPGGNTCYDFVVRRRATCLIGKADTCSTNNICSALKDQKFALLTAGPPHCTISSQKKTQSRATPTLHAFHGVVFELGTGLTSHLEPKRYTGSQRRYSFGWHCTQAGLEALATVLPSSKSYGTLRRVDWSTVTWRFERSQRHNLQRQAKSKMKAIRSSETSVITCPVDKA